MTGRPRRQQVARFFAGTELLVDLLVGDPLPRIC
jgi:hypothetical protein